MELKTNGSLFSLTEDETDRLVVSGQDLLGFFVDPSKPPPRLARLTATDASLTLAPSRLHDIAIEVRNIDSSLIGHYYIGDVELISSRIATTAPDRTDIDIDFGITYPFPYAREIWRRWADGEPLQVGEWRRLPAIAHSSWLHVSQQVWSVSASAVPDATVPREVDCAELETASSLYCALGEAMRGPGGYFGSNLDALDDCLTSWNDQVRLTFLNASRARRAIGTEFDAVVAVLRDHLAEIRLEAERGPGR